MVSLEALASLLRRRAWGEIRELLASSLDLVEPDPSPLNVTATDEDLEVGLLVSSARLLGAESAVEEAAGWAAAPAELRAAQRLALRATRAYKLSDDPGDVDAAAVAWERVIGAPAFASLARAARLTALNSSGNVYWFCHSNGRRGGAALSRAAYGRALALAVSASERSLLLANLTFAYEAEYDLAADVNDLEAAIAAGEEALALTHGSQRPRRCNYLATLLRRRFRVSGAMTDFDSAIALYEEAAAGAVGSFQPVALNSLCAAYRARFELRGDLADLDRAIAAGWRAVMAHLDTGYEWPGHATTLAGALLRRAIETRDANDILQAEHLIRAALSMTQSKSRRRLSRITNLGLILRRKAGLVDEWRAETLDEAVAMLQEALDGCEDERRPRFLKNLADAVRDRAEANQSDKDADDARNLYAEAIRQGGAQDPWAALEAGREWGSWALGHQELNEAVAAFAAAADAAEELGRRQLLRSDKWVWRRVIGDVFLSLAEALIRLKRLREAAVAVERGRAAVLTEAIERDRLIPDDAADVQNVYRRLREASDQVASFEAAPRRQARTLSASLAELNEAIEAVRRLPGRSGFLRNPTYQQLVAAGSGAPIVYLGAASTIGFAVVVHDRGEPTGFLLPGLDRRSLAARLEAVSTDAQQRSYSSWADALDELLGWTGKIINPALAEAVGKEGAIILVPCGPLAAVPLHAAWTVVDGKRRYVADGLRVSYTPNARLLLADDRPRPGRPRLLCVSALDDLRFGSAPLDVSAAVASFPSATVLEGSDATVERVLRELPRHDVLHLACHGHAARENPLASSLRLVDGDLPLSSILQLNLQAQLVVLAACETAVPGDDIPDEVVAFPSAFLHAGATAVVGTLFSVSHIAASELLARFYENWRAGVSPVAALHQAQLQLRIGEGELPDPAWWAGFAYVGADLELRAGEAE